jgi:hypothetical protein
VQALIELSRDMTVVFAVHPRTRRRLEEFALLGSLTGAAAIASPSPSATSSS